MSNNNFVFFVIGVALISLIRHGLPAIVLAAIKEHENYKNWHNFIAPIENSESKLYWDYKTKELILMEEEIK